jgi:hypothetical protein
MQYCLVAESIDPQRFGALLETPVNVTIHHSLWMDNQSRNPKAKAQIEFINNVVYNWGSSGFVGGHSSAHHHQDIISNYFISGPSSTNNFLSMFSATDHVYHQGNYVDLDKNGALNGRLVADSDFVREKATLEKKKQNNPEAAVKTEKAKDAYKTVMAQAGASLYRDAVDQRLIGYARSLGRAGKIYKTEADAGGQGSIAAAKAANDSDGDGMPDEWEKKKGFDPANAADGAEDKNRNGYTNLEEYLNALVSKRK